MIKEIREIFNSEFTDANFKYFIDDIQRSTNNNLDFKICETPLFIDEDLTQKLIEASNSFLKEIKSCFVINSSNKLIKFFPCFL